VGDNALFCFIKLCGRGSRVAKRIVVSILLAWVALASSGWAAEKGGAQLVVPEYRIGPGDVLSIEVWKDPACPGGHRVARREDFLPPDRGADGGGPDRGGAQKEIEVKISASCPTRRSPWKSGRSTVSTSTCSGG